MHERHNSFLSFSFLRSIWGFDYEAFKGSPEEKALEDRLVRWAAKADLKETSAEAALIDDFFKQTWNYVQSGQQPAGKSWHSYPQYPVKGAGQKGAHGTADLATGYFTDNKINQVPQVLCEFKDIKSGLDVPQKGRKDGFSPVKQCLNYLSNARRDIDPSEPVIPQWGIVTDMNEFRLYWHDRGQAQYLKFTIRKADLFSEGLVIGDGTLPNHDEARFERFLFWKVFHRQSLTTPAGKPLLAQIIERQWVRERKLEQNFYAEYRALREHLYQALIETNPNFKGTKGRLVRLAQKILDRCIFVFFCEDMGTALNFHPQMLRDFLIERSRDTYFDPEGFNIWNDLVRLFNMMNKGGKFGPHIVNQFNGGLFANDPELDNIKVPNRLFCISGQASNEASLFAHKLTVLYLSASYNYAGGWAEGLTKPKLDDAAKNKANEVKADPDQSLGLYTLGRIFEQSITELEILEAEADGRASLNDLSKRKRDGVYYTPEWVVERIVAETIGPVLEKFKRDAGWPPKKDPNEAQIEAYRSKLQKLKIVDPACGSGAFLITSLRYLLEEYKKLQGIRFLVTNKAPNRDDDQIVADILKSNIYGVDINAASVEIARLALWLHTARGDRPLSSLEGTIKEGNSLINSDFYKGQVDLDFYNDEERERINTFDWENAFPEVFEQGGFDAVVGNPPYVKLQNFRTVHADMAAFLKSGRGVDGATGYLSAKTGNFDLYLPFIEKGLDLLNEHGRLGYIAPSVWVMNDYGRGLRNLISRGKNLDRWLDFKSHQIFDEATVYTALQFFTKTENKVIEIAVAPDGSVPEEPWVDPLCRLPTKKLQFGDRWLLITGPERDLIDKLIKVCDRLDSSKVTSSIFVGLQTSADEIYHLVRLGPGRYLHTPKGKNAPPAYEIALEESLMKPLVSGSEAKRYQRPQTENYLLFPYQKLEDTVSLIPDDRMRKEYPLAWSYLLGFEGQLRKREAKLDKQGEFILNKQGKPEKAPFNDDHWYRFGRHQGLGMQETAKLLVPRLVSSLRCLVDTDGAFYLDNVDVGGVAVADRVDPFFIAGMLNSPTADFVFKRISKPFRGDFLSANKQFIAPIPIPKVSSNEMKGVAKRARALQEAHTAIRDKILAFTKRTSEMPTKTRAESFLFPSILPARERLDKTPKALDAAEALDWAKHEYKQEIDSRMAAINARLSGEPMLEALLDNGELKFLIDGISVIDKVFVDEDEGPLILAQWKAVGSTIRITGKDPAKRLCAALRKLVVTTNEAQIKQIIKLQKEVSALEASIAVQERELNEFTYQLYKLTDDEIKMVENR